MSESAAQDHWVLQVLGFDTRQGASSRSANAAGGKDVSSTPEAAAPTPKDANGADLQAAWNAAKDAVDTKLNELAKELRAFADPQLDRIADKGLFGVMQSGETVLMATALTLYGRAGPQHREKAVTAVRLAVKKYRSGLNGNPKVKMLDDNPFGIKVAIVATMEAALQKIEKFVG